MRCIRLITDTRNRKTCGVPVAIEMMKSGGMRKRAGNIPALEVSPTAVEVSPAVMAAAEHSALLRQQN